MKDPGCCVRCGFLRFRLAHWWGALRPLGRTLAGASALGALVLPPAVFFTAIMSGAPIAMPNLPRDLAGAVVGGAVIGAGFFLLGTVLGVVEVPRWMRTGGARRASGAIGTNATDTDTSDGVGQ